MTASAVCSLSLEPVLLVVCIDNRLAMHKAIEASKRFAVNVLGERDEELARRFARRAEDKFAGVALVEGSDPPALAKAIAHFICTVEERVPGGDHSIFIGKVSHCEAMPGRRPLLYYRSAFGATATPTPTSRRRPAGGTPARSAASATSTCARADVRAADRAARGVGEQLPAHRPHERRGRRHGHQRGRTWKWPRPPTEPASHLPASSRKSAWGSRIAPNALR